MKKKSKAPSTNIRHKDRFMEAVEAIIIYSELANGARKILALNQKLSPQLDMKLQIEIGFCFNLLQNIFKIPLSVAKGIAISLHDNEEKFKEEAEKFAESLVPNALRKIELYNGQDLHKLGSMAFKRRG